MTTSASALPLRTTTARDLAAIAKLPETAMPCCLAQFSAPRREPSHAAFLSDPWCMPARAEV